MFCAASPRGLRRAAATRAAVVHEVMLNIMISNTVSGISACRDAKFNPGATVAPLVYITVV
jgi:hypothetical protein